MITEMSVHNRTSILYYLSRFFERLSFYGIKGVLVLYMIDTALNIEQMEAVSMYGTIVAFLSISQILGAIIGDLVIGNRKAIILGSILLTLGSCILSIPSMLGFYGGVSLLILGSGLFSPNVLAGFGKSYLNRMKGIDSGFTLFYVIVNLGALLGIMCIGYIGETYGWHWGFLLAGLFALLSVIPMLLVKDEELTQDIQPMMSKDKRTLNIVLSMIFVSLFWVYYEIGGIPMTEIGFSLQEVESIDFTFTEFTLLTSEILLVIGVLATILWAYVYKSQWFKLTLGFVFGAAFFGVLYYILQSETGQHLELYIVALGLLGVSEILIAPTFYSMLTKYANPKYLAILISIEFLPTRICSVLFGVSGVLGVSAHSNSTSSTMITSIIMAIIALGLFIYLVVRKNNKEVWD